MPEKPNYQHIYEKLLCNKEFKESEKTSANISSVNNLKSYTWNSSKDEQGTSKDVNDIMLNLLEKNLISDDASALLKNENRQQCDPAIVMELRHEMVKVRNHQKQSFKSENIVAEAKRLIKHEEAEKVAIEKELELIDEEINSFKKKLEYNKKKLLTQVQAPQFSMYRRSRFSRIRQTGIPKLMLSSNDDSIVHKHTFQSKPKQLLSSDNGKVEDKLRDESTQWELLPINNDSKHCQLLPSNNGRAANKDNPKQWHLSPSNNDSVANKDNFFNQWQLLPSNNDSITNKENFKRWQLLLSNKYSVLNKDNSKQWQLLTSNNDGVAKKDTFKQWQQLTSDNDSEANKDNFKQRQLLPNNNERDSNNSKQVHLLQTSINVPVTLSLPNPGETVSPVNIHLASKVLKKWKKFTLKRRLLKAEENRNKILLQKCLDTWIQFIQEKKKIHAAIHKKIKTEEKIDKFLKILQDQKKALIAPALMKDLERINKANSKVHKTNMKNGTSQVAEIYGRFQSKSAPSQLNVKHTQRFQNQKNIIAEQKIKLEEQSKLIRQLQLEQLDLQAEQSTKQIKDEIKRTLSSCEMSLRPKIKHIQARVSTETITERKITVRSLKAAPVILTQMEERAQERQKRWQMIKEQKEKKLKDKERLAKEEEEAKKKAEEQQRKAKAEEVKEKVRKEKEAELAKQREKARLRSLMFVASCHYKKKLLRSGMEAFLQVIQLRRTQMKTAESYYTSRLMIKNFHVWVLNVRAIMNWKMQRASLLHKRQLLKKAFKGFLMIHDEYKGRQQVAVDFYDMHLQERAFAAWHQVTCAAYMETLYKQGVAGLHYNRVLLRYSFKSWCKLPFVMRLEREKEKRRQILRRKVQEMLPDYNPSLSFLDADSYSS